MRVVVGRPQKVGVVRRDYRQAEVAGEAEHELVEPSLSLGVVPLHLEEVPVLEHLGVPAGSARGPLVVVVQKMGRHLPRHAGRGDHQSLVVQGQELAIYPRLGIKPLGVRERRQLDQVSVPDGVTREDHEVVVGLGERSIRVAGDAVSAPLPAVPGRDICLHADDRLEAGFLRLLLELPRRVQITMVGNGDGRLLELLGARDQVIDAVGAIEEGVLGVTMQVNEGHQVGDNLCLSGVYEGDRRLRMSLPGNL